MLKWNEARFSRVFGDVAVLVRLEHLGRSVRSFDNLVRAGFPEHQLAEARECYFQDAGTAVERFAAEKMTEGFFEDESLLALFCRYYECSDWKLEQSPWFFSKEEYRSFFRELINPVEYHIAKLEQGNGEKRWGGNFVKLPYDLGMEQAKRSLWEEISRRDFPWKPQANYGHMRAQNAFQYLYGSVDIVDFSVHQFHYRWEQLFRNQFAGPLERFQEALERCVRQWQDMRKETTRGFRYGAYETALAGADASVRQAFAHLGLAPETTSLGSLRNAFRNLSKTAHPDHGGSPKDFHRLSASKEVIENWLKRPRRP